MKEKIPYKTYRASMIHSFFAMVNRLPGPSWLYYLGLIIVLGLLNISVAWIKQVIPLGKINWYFAFTAFFLGYYLFVLDIHFQVAKESIIEYMPKINKTENDKSRILFEFTHLPLKGSALVFSLGLIVGIILSIIQLQSAKEFNPAFRGFEVTIFTLSVCMVFLADYAVFRASKLIMNIFGELRNIDIYDLSYIYSITKYFALVIILTIPPTYLIFILAPTFVKITSYFFIVSLVLYWVFVLLIFWSPLRAVNRELVFEKRRMLTKVNSRIKKTFELINHKTDSQEFGEIRELHEVINSLKSEKEFIESIRTWPWKPATLTSLLSALIIPLLIAILSEIISKII